VSAWPYLVIALEIPFSVVAGEANRSLINFALYGILFGESILNKCNCYIADVSLGTERPIIG